MANRKLYLFVTSERPDAYLNSICHCVLEENVTEIIFLAVKKMATPGEPAFQSPEVVEGNVTTLLHALAERGEYQNLQGKCTRVAENKPQSELIKRHYQDVRRRIGKKSPMVIPYHELPAKMREIAKKETKPIFDITGIDKGLIGDLISICILSNINNLSSFHLHPKPDFNNPWKMLHHEFYGLEKGKGRDAYDYVNTLSTEIFRISSKSIARVSLGAKIFGIISLATMALTSVLYFWFDKDHSAIGWLGLLATVTGLLTFAQTLYLNFRRH